MVRVDAHQLLRRPHTLSKAEMIGMYSVFVMYRVLGCIGFGDV